jgi:hypothetical protein
MLRAINLDQQPSLQTDEIYDVGPDRHLPSEFMAEQLPIAQTLPKPLLGVGAVSAKFTGMLLLQGWVFGHD